MPDIISENNRIKIPESKFHNEKRGKYIRDLVYGAIDGIITTFAVVAGVTGADLSTGIVLILGCANLFADGISMALGNFISLKSEREYFKTEKKKELWEIKNRPKEEIEELKKIYRQRGFNEKETELVVNAISRDKKVWLDTMMKDELGIIPEKKSPAKAGIATFIAFTIAGAIPVISYVVASAIPSLADQAFLITIVFTAITIFLAGAARTFVIGKKWYMAGLEMLLVGAVAAFAAYGIGFLLKGFL